MKPEDLNPIRDALKSVHRNAKRTTSRWFGPFRYSPKGKGFSCSHCGNELFFKGKGQANTRFMSFIDLDWLDPQMTILRCSECGLLFWLIDAPEKIDPGSDEEERDNA